MLAGRSSAPKCKRRRTRYEDPAKMARSSVPLMYMYTYMYTPMSMCVHVFVNIHAYMYMYMMHMSKYIYIYIYIYICNETWGRPSGIPEPEGDLTWTPEGNKIDPKLFQIAMFFASFFRWSFEPKMVTDWFSNHSKANPKSVSIPFFHIDRWEDSERLNPWKGAPRVHEMIIVSKSSIPILVYFLKQKW